MLIEFEKFQMKVLPNYEQFVITLRSKKGNKEKGFDISCQKISEELTYDGVLQPPNVFINLLMSSVQRLV